MFIKKHKKIFLIISLLVALLLLIVYSQNNSSKETVLEIEKPDILVSSFEANTEAEDTKNNSAPTNINNHDLEEGILSQNETVSLSVSGQTYEVVIFEGDSVYDVMKRLSEDTLNQFNFKAQNYSFGIFINEINGVEGTPGAYWIYYVNGEEASVGVSKYILKSGDIITWNQE